ncbi:hypothetical protein SDC9_158112 [bioreactor metagenome]|uniref:Uncharacterized protein n=1 Tax=bioreactor metagenome TaxID=1076179 RepID=A0A645F8V3_9ZZZZ
MRVPPDFIACPVLDTVIVPPLMSISLFDFIPLEAIFTVLLSSGPKPRPPIFVVDVCDLISVPVVFMFTFPPLIESVSIENSPFLPAEIVVVPPEMLSFPAVSSSFSLFTAVEADFISTEPPLISITASDLSAVSRLSIEIYPPFITSDSLPFNPLQLISSLLLS